MRFSINTNVCVHMLIRRFYSHNKNLISVACFAELREQLPCAFQGEMMFYIEVILGWRFSEKTHISVSLSTQNHFLNRIYPKESDSVIESLPPEELYEIDVHCECTDIIFWET